MQITIECNSASYDPFKHGNDMAFSANWHDDTFRYHVWIGIRPLIGGIAPMFPVKLSDTIYKNTIADSRRANTIHMDLNAAKNAKIKAEIKRLATGEALQALYNNTRAAFDAFDAMRAEAERLNAIFNAWRLLDTATVDEKMVLGLI